MIGKMTEGRLKFPSSLNRAGSAPEKTLAVNGVRSHAWEFEAWVMSILQTRAEKRHNTLKTKRNSPMTWWSDISQTTDPFSLGCTPALGHTGGSRHQHAGHTDGCELRVEQEKGRGTLGTRWCRQCLLKNGERHSQQIRPAARCYDKPGPWHRQMENLNGLNQRR